MPIDNDNINLVGNCDGQIIEINLETLHAKNQLQLFLVFEIL